MCVCNADRSPVRINRWDAALTPTGFAKIVSDDLPVLHAADSVFFALHTATILLAPHPRFSLTKPAMDDSSPIFDTLETYLGSTYVNDLTLFGRTYRVTAQADSQFRLSPEDIRLLKTRNNSGGIVPLGSVATVKEVSGADQITRYNMFTAADLSGQPAPGASSGDALAAVERLAQQILPTSFTTEWTEIALQQKLAGNSAIYIFPLCVLFVFLLLSALYESWSLPLAIILIVPMCLFSSIYGVWLRSMENNIFTQIGESAVS